MTVECGADIANVTGPAVCRGCQKKKHGELVRKKRLILCQEMIDLLNYMKDSSEKKFDQSHLIYIFKKREWDAAKEETAKTGGQPKDLIDWWTKKWPKFENETHIILDKLVKKDTLTKEKVQDKTLYGVGSKLIKVYDQYLKKIMGIPIHVGPESRWSQPIIVEQSSIDEALDVLLQIMNDPNQKPRYGFCLECETGFNYKVPVNLGDHLHPWRIDVLEPIYPKDISSCFKCGSKHVVEFKTATLLPTGIWYEEIFVKNDKKAIQEWEFLRDRALDRLSQEFPKVITHYRSSRLDRGTIVVVSEASQKEVRKKFEKKLGYDGWEPVALSKKATRLNRLWRDDRDKEILKKLGHKN